MTTGLTVSLFSAVFPLKSLLLDISSNDQVSNDQVLKFTVRVITTAHKHILELIYSVFAKDFEYCRVGGAT